MPPMNGERAHSSARPHFHSPRSLTENFCPARWFCFLTRFLLVCHYSTRDIQPIHRSSKMAGDGKKEKRQVCENDLTAD